MIFIFEMDSIKCELFDCDQFIITIDDLIVQLIDSLKFDKEEDMDEY